MASGNKRIEINGDLLMQRVAEAGYNHNDLSRKSGHSSDYIRGIQREGTVTINYIQMLHDMFGVNIEGLAPDIREEKKIKDPDLADLWEQIQTIGKQVNMLENSILEIEGIHENIRQALIKAADAMNGGKDNATGN